MKKIAIIRGPYLQKFEMQSYEPLMKYYDITCYVSSGHFFNLDDITLPIKELSLLKLPFSRINYKADRVVTRILQILIGPTYYMAGLEKELRDKDIAHVAELTHAFSYQAIMAKKKYGLKVVVTVWENIPYNYRNENTIFRKKYKKEVINNADIFIAVTNRTKEALLEEDIPEEKIKVIPAGVDTDKFKPRKKDKELLSYFGLTENDVIILFVGRLAKEKGIDYLLLASKKILEDRALKEQNIKFLFVGRGPEKLKVKKFIEHFGGLKRFVLIDSLPYDQVPNIYNLADIFVLPSIPTAYWQEQFGMVLVESLASGIPVISTLSGSIPDVIGDAGILVQPYDFLSLYQNMKKLILMPNLRKELASKARKRAEEKFNARLVAEQYKSLYENISK